MGPPATGAVRPAEVAAGWGAAVAGGAEELPVAVCSVFVEEVTSSLAAKGAPGWDSGSVASRGDLEWGGVVVVGSGSAPFSCLVVSSLGGSAAGLGVAGFPLTSSRQSARRIREFPAGAFR